MTTSGLLAGRTALVTGAGRGIGAATARALGRHGAAVAVNFHSNEAAAQAVVADIEAAGSKAVAVRGDVTDPDHVRALVDTATGALGDIDVLVCNVIGDTRRLGALIGKPGSAVETLERATGLRQTAIAQLDASLYCCHFALPSLRRRGGGSIVFIGASGTHASTASTPEILVAKSAQDALARSLAADLAPEHIRVNTVAPGMVPTDANAGEHQAAIIERVVSMTPLGSVTTAEEVADTVVALVSDLGRRLTGVFVPLDGGRTLL